jgi:hypothetical protein
MNQRAWNIVNTTTPGSMEYQFNMCDTDLWWIDAALELLAISIFLVAVIKMNL